ncbi:Fic family protein [Lactobacillus sp. 3B(2020)]|uniref:Fic/DOC family protein n=1 Tax=Lactobacillus sp. 3B(2020) TaxID=2695882 RepID=UPI0015DFFA69|nr:Fic family protein [Lactobacillus sp. 3B(2020)]QLL69133.1 cell filamentation protein Fic [Lactobacillus sp. 3B(2020)]
MKNIDQELKAKFQYSNGTLRNKLGIQRQSELMKVEYQTVSEKTVFLFSHYQKIRPIKSINDLAKIHKFLYGDLYDWAGEFRNYELAKDGTNFMLSHSFPEAIKAINDLIQDIQRDRKPSVSQYAQLLDYLNYFHPFREGNGRSTKTLLVIMAAQKGQYLNYNRQDEQVIEALKNADVKQLEKFIRMETLADKNKIMELAAQQQISDYKKKFLKQRSKRRRP